MELNNLTEENYLMNIIKKYSGKYTPKDLINKIKIDYIQNHKEHNNRLLDIENIVISMINTGEIELRDSDDAFRSKVCWLRE